MLIQLQEIIALSFISLFIGLSQTAGIGGGPIINVCLLLKEYLSNGQQQAQVHNTVESNSKATISLTYLFIIGGSLASIYRNMKNTSIDSSSGRPKSNISLQLILITLPIMNAGSMLGSLLKSFLSQLFITILFILVFGLLIWQIYSRIPNLKCKSKDANENRISDKCMNGSDNVNNDRKQKDKMNSKKYMRLQSKPEQQQQNHQHSSQQIKIKQQNPNYPTSSNKTGPQHHPSLQIELQTQIYNNNDTPSIVKNQPTGPNNSKQINILHVVGLSLTMYALTVLISLIRGGANYPSIIGMDSCGIAGAFIVIAYCAFAYVISNISIKYIQNIHAHTNMQQIPNNTQLTKYSSIPLQENTGKKLLSAGMSAGIVGAALGIGGAPILIPIWLSAGIQPIVCASSTHILILNSALVSITIAYFMNCYEAVSNIKIIAYFLLAFFSTIAVKDLVSYFVNKYKLKDAVVVILFWICIISLIVLLPMQFVKMINGIGQFTTFGKLC